MATPGYIALLRHRPGMLAVAFLAVFSGNLGQSFFIGLFQQPIAERLGLGAGGFGVAYAAVTLCAGVLILRLGPSLDWVPPRRFALLALAGLAGGILLLTLSPWLVTAFLGLGVLRLCGQGLLTLLGQTLAGREFGPARGRALGLVSLGMPLGEMVLPPLVAVGWALGWREVLWCLLAVLALFWLPLLGRGFWPRAPRVDIPAGSRRGRPRPFRELRFWRLLPLLMMLPTTMTGVFIYQARLTEDFGASLATYALALTAMGLSRLPGALLGGYWIDRRGVGLPAMLLVMPFGLGLSLAVWLAGDAGVWLLLVGAGFTMGMHEPTVNALLGDLWGSENLGRMRATLGACAVFATSLAPALFGGLMELGVAFREILTGVLACLPVVLALAWPCLRAVAHAPGD